MKKSTLYLHIGWSKTGTSAVQQQLDLKFNELKSKGILYSRKLQMNDNAHHHFALAFRGTTGYKAKYTVPEVLDILDHEMAEYGCSSAIISSELSPFYFNNQKFKNWVEDFEQVVVIASVRQQSDLLLSLYNQLIKDPQVRYKGSFFQLTLNNISNLNYFQTINRWSQHVGQDNIKIINYQSGVVGQFLDFFMLSSVSNSVEEVVNPSLPTSSLLRIQEQGRDFTASDEYRKMRDRVVEEIGMNETEPSVLLVSSGELLSIDNFFRSSNDNLSKVYVGDDILFRNKVYQDIYVY